MLKQLQYSSFPENIKTSLKLVVLFAGLICLGASLALYSESQLLIIPFLGALALTSFTALDYALYILVAFLPFSFRFKMLSGTEMQIPTEPLLAIIAVALAFRWIATRSNKDRVKFPFRFPLMLYVISLGLSMLSAGNLYFTIKGSIRASAYMLLAVAVFHIITDKRRLKWLFITAIVPATVAVGWTMIFLISRLNIWMYSQAYEGLLFTSYVHYGAFVAIIFLILFARFIFDRGRYDRVIWTFLLIFFSAAICLSFSRGVWVSLIVAVGFMFVPKTAGIQHKKILMIMGGALFLILLLNLPHVSGLILSRAKTITSFGFGSNKARLLRWGTALMMFLRSPIIGCGYGSFAFTYVNDLTLTGQYVGQYQMGAHSEYLQVLAETGLVGFTAWISIIASFIFYGFRLLKDLNDKYSILPNASFWRSLVIGVMAAEVSFLVHFLVNNLIQGDIIGVPFWLLMGLLPTIGNIVNKEYQSLTENEVTADD